MTDDPLVLQMRRSYFAEDGATGALMGMVLSALVVHDVVVTNGYAETTCQGLLLSSRVDGNGLYSHAVARVPFGYNQTAALYFPAIRHWLLGGVKQGEANTWLAGLAASQTFQCWVEDLQAAETDGISSRFELGGWITMMVLAIL